MEVIRSDTGADFLKLSEAFLVEQEAANSLVLGIPTQLALYPGQARQAPYLASVVEGDQVLAAGVMTPPMRAILSTSESRAAVAALAADVASFERATPGCSGPTVASQWFAEEWHLLQGDAALPSMSERIYSASQITAPAGVPGAARRAGGSDRDLLIEWFTAFDLEAFGTMGSDTPARVDGYFEMSVRGIYLWEDGGTVVSLAAYSGYTPHGARVGPVYTPPDRRGHGYASAVTAALSQHLLNRDRRFCCLFTNLANLTANHIYQTIGYAPVCDVSEYQFSPSALPAARSQP
jgi:GNAT superfamily N-acetyltransferase